MKNMPREVWEQVLRKSDEWFEGGKLEAFETSS